MDLRHFLEGMVIQQEMIRFIEMWHHFQKLFLYPSFDFLGGTNSIQMSFTIAMTQIKVYKFSMYGATYAMMYFNSN